jgi:hypothetical protein
MAAITTDDLIGQGRSDQEIASLLQQGFPEEEREWWARLSARFGRLETFKVLFDPRFAKILFREAIANQHTDILRYLVSQVNPHDYADEIEGAVMWASDMKRTGSFPYLRELGFTVPELKNVHGFAEKNPLGLTEENFRDLREYLQKPNLTYDDLAKHGSGVIAETLREIEKQKLIGNFE